MQFRQLHSGSEGNLYEIIAANGKRLLIDPGVTWAKVLKALNYDLSGIVGCLASHVHADHCKSIRDVMTFGINVYASKKTFASQNLLQHRKTRVVADKTLIRMEEFQVLCFATNHDCEGSLGFVVRESATNEYLLFATDTSHITQRFPFKFSIVAVECSYDEVWLRDKVAAGEIDERLAERLLTSHMSKANCMAYLNDYVDRSKLRELHLIHMSGTNIDRQRTAAEFKNEFFVEVKTI